MVCLVKYAFLKVFSSVRSSCSTVGSGHRTMTAMTVWTHCCLAFFALFAGGVHPHDSQGGHPHYSQGVHPHNSAYETAPLPDRELVGRHYSLAKANYWPALCTHAYSLLQQRSPVCFWEVAHQCPNNQCAREQLPCQQDIRGQRPAPQTPLCRTWDQILRGLVQTP
jgi:hypothetical protein